MEQKLNEAVVYRKTSFRLLTQSSRFYLQLKTIDGFNNDIEYLRSMQKISESVAYKLRNKQQFFSSTELISKMTFNFTLILNYLIFSCV